MNNIVIYKEGELEIEVQVNPEQDTVWLNQSQMANLFDVSSDNIGLHIKISLMKANLILQLPRNSR